MELYEVSLTIRKEASLSKISYYERWLINPVRHEPYFQPILEQVFERDVSMAPEPQEQWYVLVQAKSSKERQKAFSRGRELIREFLNNKALVIED